jgi:precorrin-2/cobalt-factor-2 C20-methyltransferase
VLIGLGLGPGEPEYLTLRAVRLLREADAVFVPGKIALSLVSAYRDAEVLDFPMTGDEDAIAACMERNADHIATVARDGTAILGILGDPNFFSTYARLVTVMAEKYPEIECRTEPAVSSITLCVGCRLARGFLVTEPRTPCRSALKVRRPRKCELSGRILPVVHSLNVCYGRDAGVQRYELPEESDYGILQGAEWEIYSLVGRAPTLSLSGKPRPVPTSVSQS